MKTPSLLAMLFFCASCATPSPSQTGSQPLPAPEVVLASHLWQNKVVYSRQTPDAPRFSFRVENFPANHLLEAIHLESGYGYEIDECGQRPVTVLGSDMTLSDLLSTLETQTDAVASVENNHIRLQCDAPFLEIYTLDYLSLSRDMSDESKLFSNLERSQPNSVNKPGNRSEFRIGTTQSHNVWGQLVTQVQSLLNQHHEIKMTEKVRSVREDSMRNYGNNRGLKSASDRDKLKHDVTITRKQTLTGQVVAHPESATLAVTATHKQHREVKKWLTTIENRLTQQVAVDAIIAEVSLSKRHQRGIDWSALRKAGSTLGVALQGLEVAQPAFTVNFSRQSNQSETSLILRLLEQFGTTSVISSPKIVTLNQQAAVLKLIDNRVFFTTDVQTSAPTNNSSAFSTFSTDVQTVPVGFLMTVTPLVSENRSIQLRVRPTLTRILGFVSDPNPALAEKDIVSRVPEIQTRELESILELRDGELALLGGLRQLSQTNDRQGLPGTQGSPLEFTQSIDNSQEQTELVVLLRARILDRHPKNNSGAGQTRNETLNKLLATSMKLQAQSAEQVRRFLKLALAQFPDSPELMLNRSIQAARDGDFDTAKLWLNNTQTHCPGPNCSLPLLQWESLLETTADANR